VDGQRQSALGADERTMAQYLHAVAEEPSLGARLGAVDAAELRLRLTRIPGVYREGAYCNT
jgi:hypothetical protein